MFFDVQMLHDHLLQVELRPKDRIQQDLQVQNFLKLNLILLNLLDPFQVMLAPTTAAADQPLAE